MKKEIEMKPYYDQLIGWNDEIKIYRQDYLNKITPCEKEIEKIFWKRNAGKLLTPRLQKVLMERFLGRKTYEEIGREWGVTRERIRQLETKALEILKDNPPSSSL